MKLEQSFFVGAHDVNQEKKVTNQALLEMLSNISMLHGAKAGQTKTDGTSQISWIVMNWHMEVYRRPRMFSTLRVVTWVRDWSLARAGRDYIIYDEENQIVVKATAEWVAMEVATGRFLRITDELVAPFGPEPENVNFPGFRFPNIRRFDPKVDLQQEMEIHRLMFDYNGHVHNSIYINLAEQILPKELYDDPFDCVEVFYKLEITNGDNVLLEYNVDEDRHYVAVRQKADRKIHAIVVFTDPAQKPA
ncbi:MAG: thioesterase [Bacillota bacterium]|nr:thioesterase [Bacillota bacterium]